MNADLIKAAATSPLGILALLILVVSTVATAFFSKSETPVKVGVFLLIFAAACVFGYTVFNTGQSPLTTSTVASLEKAAAETAPRPKSEVTPSPVTPSHKEAALLAGDGLIPDSSTRRLSAADLSGLNRDQLKVARNEIYARHGYIFRSADMRDHFAGVSWYRPTASQVSLSPTELANVETIRRAEAAP